jgi:ADP-ribosylglycohydrolase
VRNSRGKDGPPLRPAEKRKSGTFIIESPKGRVNRLVTAEAIDRQLDHDTIDDAVPALLLGRHDGSRVWKSFDWDAMGLAVAAACAWRRANGDAPPEPLIEFVARHTPTGPTPDGIRHALTIPLDADVRTAVAALGNGSRIIASDAVPFCLWPAAGHLDSYEAAFWNTVSGMGDRDTTCAIVGGIVSLSVGSEGIPEERRLSREAF